MRTTIFCLLVLCIAMSPVYSQTSVPMDSLLVRMGIALGADEKIVNQIDTNKLYRAELDKNVHDRHFYEILNYQHTLKVKAKGEIPVNWLLVGAEGGKVTRLIFVLSKEKSIPVSKMLGTPKLISVLPGIRASDTELRSWENPAYNVLLYSDMADGTENTLIIYKGEARTIFKF